MLMTKFFSRSSHFNLVIKCFAISLLLCSTITLIDSSHIHAALVSPDQMKRPPDGKISILINPVTRRLIVNVNGTPYHAYPVAIGKRETPTPIGDFKVAEKHVNWGTGFGTRWIGLDVPWGMYGIHGTNKPGSIGTYASHGCIRMLNRHVEELYKLVKVGTRVTIAGHVLGNVAEEPRRLVQGHTGGDVMLVQNRLRAGGYFHGTCNGKFGPATAAAVRAFERANGLSVDGVVDDTMYEALGLLE
jgi:lipoprotein-anchoring transpeptidase ErfK/SrfK